MTTSDPERHRTIAQVNRMLRSILEAETLEHFFWVGGRIDRFYQSDLGHVYFDLVDDKSRIKCFLREERAGRFPFDLRNHLDIEVYGDIHFYEERAETQINVMDLRISDESADIKPVIERLRAQGLYPPNKRMPPANIGRIGIITSRSSRAIGDFESAYQSAGERGVLAPVTWKYVALEGDRAAQSIVDAITVLGKDPDIDLIAVIRGGGRPENLAVFDTFEIAQAVIRCDTFIVTGIGHHKDSTLADDVADYAASTPTAVAHYLADLCLRSLPAKTVAFRRYSEQSAATKSSPHDHVSGNTPIQTSSPATNQHSQPVASPSRFSNVLIVILLVLAVASIAFLIAVMIAQT